MDDSSIVFCNKLGKMSTPIAIDLLAKYLPRKKTERFKFTFHCLQDLSSKVMCSITNRNPIKRWKRANKLLTTVKVAKIAKARDTPDAALYC